VIFATGRGTIPERAGSDASRNEDIIMSTDHDISVLNGLIKTTLDSMKGYEDAAKDAESTQFATMFADFARDRGAVVMELRAAVAGLGGTPEDGSSFLAAAHRTFMDLKQLFATQDDKAIIQEVERGEDHIKAKFESALEDRELASASVAAIRAGYASVKEGHDRMSTLKHSMA
jgi:uncharacterized protein (TIGR02284 family)